MKNTEIRIGNIIGRQFFNIANRKIEIRDCICLEPRQSRCLVRLGKSNRAIFYEDLEGIPLTEEWLLRLGFKCFPWGWVVDVNGNYKVLIKFQEKPNLSAWLEVGNGHRADFTFVHELQNLFFALTGEELTIRK
jgi:hypothetical protein